MARTTYREDVKLLYDKGGYVQDGEIGRLICAWLDHFWYIYQDIC